MTTKPRLTAIEAIQLRRSTGMTQAVFGEALGVSRRTVEGWECEDKNPAPWFLTLAVHTLLIQIAEKAGVAEVRYLPAAKKTAGYEIASVTRSALRFLDCEGWSRASCVDFVCEIGKEPAAELARMLSTFSGRAITTEQVADAMSIYPVTQEARP